MTNSKKILAALALVAASASVALAQSDFGSPLGAGAGVGGSVAPLGLPGGGTGPGGATPGALSSSGARGLAAARTGFLNAGTAGSTVSNPAGGTVVVPQATARALAGVLGGTPTAAQNAAVIAALGPVPASSAGALVRALAAFGASSNHGSLSNAVAAYNAAVDALPAGSPPPPALLGVRSALFAASAR